MKFIETHIHLQDFPKECTEKIVSEAIAVGVEGFLCVSSKPCEWQEVLSLAKSYPQQVFPALGIHPWYVGETQENDLRQLEDLLLNNPKALIGEAGLDGYKDFSELQEKFFVAQCDLAKKYHRPLIIHCVKAQQWFEKNWNLLPPKFVFHSYSGKEDFAKKIVQQDGYVSFSFSILKNTSREAVLKSVPLNRLLLETDSPYQTFEKDVENNPVFLPHLFFEIAKILEIKYEDFTKKIYQNATEFLKVE
ncbi:MAG: TatD family hydrolase [Alphaproteobacteria bacterium]